MLSTEIVGDGRYWPSNGIIDFGAAANLDHTLTVKWIQLLGWPANSSELTGLLVWNMRHFPAALWQEGAQQ
jgi:hypothetical protein